MDPSKTITIRVRYISGAYVTNTVQGKRASCTHSSKEAAEALARKLAPNAGRALRDLGRCDQVDQWALDVFERTP